MVFCVFVFIHLKIFSSFLCDFSFFDPLLILEYVINFYILVNFPNFLQLLTSNFFLLWSENTLCMISILLKFTEAYVCHILGNSPFALEKSATTLLLCEMFCRCLSLALYVDVQILYFLVDLLSSCFIYH